VVFLESWVYGVAALIAFWSGLYIARQFLPKNFEVHPFLIMWKTTKFNNFIDHLAKKLRRFYMISFTLGIAISAGAMIYIFYILARNLFFIIFQTESASPVTLVIPGITLSLDFNTLFFFGISIAVILITHELAHGVAARAEGVKVKSTGLMLLAIIPGAFVEPDEEDLNKAKKSTQARVYAAGTTTNILIGLFCLALISVPGLIVSPFCESTTSGVQITGVVAGSPADGPLKVWDAITSVNGTPVTDPQSFSAVLTSIAANSTVQIIYLRDSAEQSVDLTLGTSPRGNYSYVGVNTFAYYAPKYSFIPTTVPFYFLGSLSSLYLWSLNIGLINMMPAAPFDGEKLATTILRFVIKDEKKVMSIANIMKWGSLAILILNIVLSFIIFPNFRIG
jgi:membrane-associated protease RseP (regulator of RpoE activity)